MATKRILIPKSFHAVLAHHHISIGLAAAKEKEGESTEVPFQSSHSCIRPVHVPDVPGEGVPRQLLETVRADFLPALSLQRLCTAAVIFFRTSS